MAFPVARISQPALRAAAPVRGARHVVAKAQDKISVPYATGMLELAQERGNLDEVHKDLMTLQAMMALKEDNISNELRVFMMGVPLGQDRRKEIIDTLAKDISMQKETCDFLKLLIDTNRMDAIEDIVDVFDEKYNVITDTTNVTLRSAARLEQDQEFEIAKQMQEATQSKNIKIKPVVDESLMGGFIVEWGDNQVDLSIKGHLDRIESDLMSAAGAV